MYIAKSFISTLVATLVATTAFADENVPVEPKEKSAWESLSTTLTVGYDSRYVLYGYRLSRHLWHADVWLTYPLNDRLTLTGGSWYGYLTDGTYRELDGYTGVDYALTGNIYVGFQYSYFGYIDVPWPTRGYANEYAAHVSYWGEFFNLSIRNQYDDEAKGSLMRMLAGCSMPLFNQLTLKVDAEAGYAFEYYIDGNAWNHAQVKISSPYQVGTRLALTPFIAYTAPLAAIDSFEEEEVYYGLSGSVLF